MNERWTIGFDGKYHFFHRLVAFLRILSHIFCIAKKKREAWGNKKNMYLVIWDICLLVWKYNAWVEAYYEVDAFIDDYFVERLYLRSRNVKNFIIQSEGIQTFVAMNLPAMKKLNILNSKDAFHAFCSKNKLPHASAKGYLICKNAKPQWKTNGGICCDLNELLQDGPVICKPERGMHGKGIIALRSENGKYYCGNKECTEDEIITHIPEEGLMVEELIENHSILKDLHPSSLNTVRMVTLKTKDGIEVFVSILRMGVNGTSVDNLCSGGITVLVHPDGSLASDGWFKDYKKSPSSLHPNSKIIFENIKLPFYAECIELVKKAHSKLPRVYGIGWDVAITPNGPVLIEGNAFFGFQIIQLQGIPCRTLIDGERKQHAQKNVKLLFAPKKNPV